MPTLFLSLTQKPSNYWKGQAFSSAKSRPWKWHFILRYVPQKHLTGQVISQRGIPQSYGVANVAEWFSNDFLQMAKAREGAAMNIFRIKASGSKTRATFLNSRQIHLVIDVGANKGQYAKEIRQNGI
jgi:hypothetical protein